MRLPYLLAMLLAGVAAFSLAARSRHGREIAPPRPRHVQEGHGTQAAELLPAAESIRIPVSEPEALRRADEAGAASYGAVAPGAIVSLRPADPRDLRSYDVRADAQGRYAFERIPAGRYLLRAEQPQPHADNLICVVSEEKRAGVEITLLDQRHLAQDLVVGR